MAEVNVAIPKNSEIFVEVVPNNTEAYVRVSEPENGGKGVTRQDIMDALKKNNVVFGIREEMIDSILEYERYEQKLCVAMAQMPVDGENGEITYMYEKENTLAPVEDEHGFVDYKDLGLIRMVHPGDVIAQIKHPTEGVDGTDVRKGIMRAIHGKKASYTIGVNTSLSEDGTQIVSNIDGHLVFKNGAFNVDSLVTINSDVDISVGNIDFIGDIIIKGNVFEGFKVSSNANITIYGEVNGATVEAGGNVLIKKGCINSNIISHGNVSAQFCEHSNIKCDGDLSAQNFVICDVYCGGTITTTKTSSGGLIGGRYTILSSIEVSNIGSKHYIPTEITIGNNAILAEEKNNLLNEIAKLNKQINDLTLIVNFLNEKKKELHHLPEDKEQALGNAVRQKVLHSVSIKNAEKRIKEIDLSLASRQQLTVKCKGYIYPGTRITINDINVKIDDEYVRTCVSIGEDGMPHFGPL
ncbi:MAG: DUF342 domain-containing protein [Oscillospiraceae bacterium]|nr:DUF342 domain-containing protein [Oscillospiraceae bacterium]